MEQLVTAILDALKKAGVACARQTPQGQMPQLRGPVTAVSLAAARAMEHAFYEDLGQTQEGENLFGKRLEADVKLTVVCPRALGSARCQKEAARVAELLSGQIAGVTLVGYTVGACAYDAGCDCFVCPLTAQMKAYVYATANEDETEFTDFMLKGEVR